MSIEIFVPDIGDDEVAVTEILVKVGDSVEADQSLLTVEGDKASMEVPSPQAGVVKAIKIAVGDKVNTGTLIMEFEAAAAAASAPAPVAAAAAPAPAEKPAARRHPPGGRRRDAEIHDLAARDDQSVARVNSHRPVNYNRAHAHDHR